MTKMKKPPASGAGKGPGTRNNHNEGGKVTTKVCEPPDSPSTDKLTAALRNAIFQTPEEFLMAWKPEGPWALTAIRPDKKQIHGRLFTKQQFTDMSKWIKEHNGKFNVYFGPNTVMRDFDRKASREDIKSMDWLHIDIDARPPNPEWSPEEMDRHNQAEFARIYDLLTCNLPKGVPEPSVITFSGGGFQAFWKLQEPVLIDGEDAKFEDAKLYNVQLERIFDGDNCHNVDRIMRLPGTINIPDAKKLKKGRKPALAVVKKFADDVVYPVSAFVKAPPYSGTGSGQSNGQDENFNAKAKRIEDVNELDQWKVPDRVKVIIVQGHHPEKPKDDDNSRSNWLFDALCWLYRCGVPEDVMYAIITDEGFAISASVLDKGSNIDKYARRQMARAKGKVDADGGDPVAWVNQRYFAALEGRRVHFYREDKAEGRAALAMMNTDAFKFELAPQRHEVRTSDNSTRFIPFAKLWSESNRRRYYRRGFVLDPKHGEHPDEYNLWRGFGVEPVQGDWSKMQGHIKDVLAAGRADHADYIIKWAAWAVQNPATPPRVALVFRGAEGIGKGVFANALSRLFGEHGLRIEQMGHLTGRFNAHQRHLCLLYADEAIAPGDAQAAGVLRGRITEPTIPIEAKGIDVVNADNHLHIVMTSNEKWVVPAAIDARRFAMFQVPDTRKGDVAYFAALWAEVNGEGLAAMLHDLLAMDLTGWHPDAQRPETSALTAQKVMSLRSVDRQWYNILLTGELPIHATEPPKEKNGPGFVWVSTTALRDHMQRMMRDEQITDNDVGGLLGDSNDQGMGFQRRETRRPRGFVLPSLDAARKRWDEKRFVVDWPTEPNDAQAEMYAKKSEQKADQDANYGWVDASNRPVLL